jgi:alkylation response protein AidB-like acyl-CoA dehydrogenase
MQDKLTSLLEHLRATAADRDRTGGHAADEKSLLRQAGLLSWSIPARFGGLGKSWPEIYEVVRRVAEVDSALAHLLAFHHLQVATVLIYGNALQQEEWLSATAVHGLWWGNAMNPLDARLLAEDDGEGYILNGIKGYCSGTRGSLMMTLSAQHASSGKVLLAVLPTGRDGIDVRDDWDPIGQRQTDSGSVAFTRVRLERNEILRSPESVPTPFQTLRTCFAQLVLVNLYAGIASGALEEARRQANARAKPRVHADVTSIGEDPYMLHRFAEMHVQATAAGVLADRAAVLLQEAYSRHESLGAEQRGAVALAIAEAKVVAHRAALHAADELFEVTGARGTAAALGLDRYWRNIRTHSLHDPLDYKLAVIGRWSLNREFPEPTLYN